MEDTEKKGAPVTAENVVHAEQQYLIERRKAAQKNGSAVNYPTTLDANGKLPDLKGLACSGGGIRSASFCMGVMQALAEHNKLIKFDYLSAVSGGSWIASSLCWFLSQDGRHVTTWDNKTRELKYGLDPEAFPFNNKQKNFSPSSSTVDEEKTTLRGRNLVSWIRGRAKVVTPGYGFGMSALIGMILRASIINLMIFVPVFLAVFVVIQKWFFGAKTASWACGNEAFHQFAMWHVDSTSCIDWVQQDLYWTIPIYVIAFFLIAATVYALVSRFVSWIGTYSYRPGGRRIAFIARSVYTKAVGYSLMILLALLTLASLPWLHGLLADADSYTEELLGLLTAAGGAWLTLLNRPKAGAPSPFIAKLAPFLIPFGCGLMIYAILFFLYSASTHIVGNREGEQLLFYIILIFAVAVGFFANINHNSIHRFYRDRLMEAFLPDPDLTTSEPAFSDRTRLSEFQLIEHERRENMFLNMVSGFLPGVLLKGMVGSFAQLEEYLKLKGLFNLFRYKVYKGNPTAPYLLINTCLTTTDSPDRKLRGRGFSHFLLSSRYVGSDATGYEATKTFMKNRMSLATAMAISGAAADPNTYVTRSRALSFVMALLNLRLGYWAPNPNPNYRPWFRRLVPAWVSALTQEMLGIGLNERSTFIHLSDGGHAENLGVYELIRRRCKTIVAIDAGADKNWRWEDLGRLIEQVRVDFGVIIRLHNTELRQVIPEKKYNKLSFPVSQRGYLVADILYPPIEVTAQIKAKKKPARRMEKGKLILIKTTLPHDLAISDIHAYKLAHPDFPDETTTDQFFDEDQFEAYRELGYNIGLKAVRDKVF